CETTNCPKPNRAAASSNKKYPKKTTGTHHLWDVGLSRLLIADQSINPLIHWRSNKSVNEKCRHSSNGSKKSIKVEQASKENAIAHRL
ncbi:hypothetical protein N8683_04305, partial [bacterium]|nr:hypothetical protein [bacterium]